MMKQRSSSSNSSNAVHDHDNDNHDNHDNESSSDTIVLNPEEFAEHMSYLQSSYFAAIEKLAECHDTILEQRKSMETLEFKLQATQEQNLKLVQELIKLKEGKQQPPEKVRSNIEAKKSVLTDSESNESCGNEKKNNISAEILSQGNGHQSGTLNQLQEKLQQLESDMASVRRFCLVYMHVQCRGYHETRRKVCTSYNYSFLC